MEVGDKPPPKMPEESTRRTRQTKSKRKKSEVKDKVRLVVGDLETVATELKAIVLDLRVLVNQIDTVTAKLDTKFGPAWRESDIISPLGIEDLTVAENMKHQNPIRTENFVQCSCNKFQLHRVMYMPTNRGSNPDKVNTCFSGYCLETDIVGTLFKSKLKPCLDYNQNESFSTEFIETQRSTSGGSEFLPPTYTSDEEKLGCLQNSDEKNRNAIGEGLYSGFYEADVDDKLENYVNIVDSFESSDDDETDLDSLRIISSLPDATNSKTRHDMVSLWAESAFMNLVTDNLSKEESDLTLTNEPNNNVFPGSKRSKSAVEDINLVSEMGLFQNEVKSDVGQYRSVLVF